ncbi:MAG: palindromic element RPE4 domain-containing protein [Deltaproteobacteria bacterium]|nr:palindromic element RPE4 domain-containing protein [Deltaproteobacteria bacterium]
MKKSSPPLSSRGLTAGSNRAAFLEKLDPAVKPRDDRLVKVCPQIDYLEHYRRLLNPVKNFCSSVSRKSFAAFFGFWARRMLSSAWAIRVMPMMARPTATPPPMSAVRPLIHEADVELYMSTAPEI